jgi:hypothetical protein
VFRDSFAAGATALLTPSLLFSARRIFRAFIVLLPNLLLTGPANAQQPSTPRLLEVTMETKDLDAEQKLSQTDFEILEGRAVIPIASFAGGSASTVRPLVIWFVLQCAENRFVSSGSGFMLGKTDLFTPILQKLPGTDVVAVAHWCDDGTFAVDLAPTADREAPAKALQSVLSAAAVKTSNDPGQDALHDVVERIQDVSRLFQSQAMPVLVFLYGDVSGMYLGQLEDTVRQVLRRSGIVYELDNGAIRKPLRITTDANRIPNSKSQVVHYLVEQTGGQVYSTWTNKYGENLDRLIGNLHRRYELGFVPPTLDGRRHEIKIKLTDEARHRLKSGDLHYAPAYLASPSLAQPEISASSVQDAVLSQALSSSARLTDVRFDASGKVPSGEESVQFRLYVDPRSLTWQPAESGSGDVQAKFTLAAAFFSTDRVIISSQVKDFAVTRAQAEQSGDSPKAVIVSLSSSLPTGTLRVRFILRDSVAHLGSFELASAQIKRETSPSHKPQ